MRCYARIGLLVAIWVLACPSGAFAAFPGSNGKIAYNKIAGGVYRINPDGSNSELVKGGEARDAVWSSDGTKIGYVDGEAIRITAADGTGSTLVCNACVQSQAANVSAITWSPDGSQFAFTRVASSAPFVFNIFRIDADGSGETQLTSVGDNRTPAWSPDGTKIAFWSDRTGGIWVMNADGTGESSITANGQDPAWSPDGSKIVFTRDGGLWTMNSDGSDQTQLTVKAPSGVVDRSAAWSPDGQQIAFLGWITSESFNNGLIVINVDGTGRTSLGVSGRNPDWQPIAPSYPRPKGATPLILSLVPASQQCTSPNRTHGPPLAFGSCSPPQRASSYLTVGTPDANGQAASSTGSLKAAVVVGNPSTQTDEADVQLSFSLTDVRNAADLTDYAGELSAQFVVRRTDKENEPFNSTPGTMVDRTFSFDVACTPTAGSEGSTCSAQTTADALVPSTVQEGRRAIWELSEGRVFDGGADGDTATNDNTLFAVGGVFVP